MPELPSDNRLVRSAREYNKCLFIGDYDECLFIGDCTENLTSENCDENLFSEDYARTVSSGNYAETLKCETCNETSSARNTPGPSPMRTTTKTSSARTATRTSSARTTSKTSSARKITGTSLDKESTTEQEVAQPMVPNPTQVAKPETSQVTPRRMLHNTIGSAALAKMTVIELMAEIEKGAVKRQSDLLNKMRRMDAKQEQEEAVRTFVTRQRGLDNICASHGLHKRWLLTGHDIRSTTGTPRARSFHRLYR